MNAPKRMAMESERGDVMVFIPFRGFLCLVN